MKKIDIKLKTVASADLAKQVEKEKELEDRPLEDVISKKNDKKDKENE